MAATKRSDLELVLERLPEVPCVISAAYDDRRAGILARWAMPCAVQPALVCVACQKGHAAAPLIRDSRHFGLTLLSPDDRAVAKRFRERPAADEPDADPFGGMDVFTLVSRSPLLARGCGGLDLEVFRHIDLDDADHELYVGRVLAGRL